jgi:hypothetical protein
MRVLELVRGGTAAVLSVSGEHVVVLSSVPSPPGSPLETKLEASTLRIKVRSCRQVEADDAGRSYRIEGRLVSLTREQRELLAGE